MRLAAARAGGAVQVSEAGRKLFKVRCQAVIRAPKAEDPFLARCLGHVALWKYARQRGRGRGRCRLACVRLKVQEDWNMVYARQR